MLRGGCGYTEIAGEAELVGSLISKFPEAIYNVLPPTEELASGEMLIGRHIMTCCADDIQYCPMVCRCKKSYDFKTYDWAIVEGEIKTERHPLYNGAGPGFVASSATHTVRPEESVATFY